MRKMLAAKSLGENNKLGGTARANSRLSVPVLGAAVSAKLIDRLLDVDDVKNARELRPLLQRL
jgi:hypothetical protein